MKAFLDLHGEDFRTDPHAVLRRFREADWRADTALGTAVLRYDEVQAVLSSWSLRTPGADSLAAQGITEGPVVDAVRGFLLNADGETHRRVRRSVGRAFSVRRVEDFRSTAANPSDLRQLPIGVPLRHTIGTVHMAIDRAETRTTSWSQPRTNPLAETTPSRSAQHTSATHRHERRGGTTCASFSAALSHRIE